MDAKDLGRLAMDGTHEQGVEALENLAALAVEEAWVTEFEGGTVNSLINKPAVDVVRAALELAFYAGVEAAALAIHHNRKVSKT